MSKKYKAHQQLERANLFERYIPEVANALFRLTGKDEKKITEGLNAMVKKDAIQQKIETMQAVNTEYDEEWARFGKEDTPEESEEDEPVPERNKAKTEDKKMKG